VGEGAGQKEKKPLRNGWLFSFEPAVYPAGNHGLRDVFGANRLLKNSHRVKAVER